MIEKIIGVGLLMLALGMLLGRRWAAVGYRAGMRYGYRQGTHEARLEMRHDRLGIIPDIPAQPAEPFHRVTPVRVIGTASVPVPVNRRRNRSTRY